MADITAHNFVYKAPFMQAGSFLPFAWASRCARKWAGRLLFSARAPAKLLYLPFDLHLADPKLAHEFYHGRFPLAGRVVQAGAVSPFLAEPPSQAWEAALQDFSWLCHLAAAQTELADAHARALILDWLEYDGKRLKGPAWAAAVAARRLTALLSHAERIFLPAAPAFQKKYLRIIGLHMRYLRLAFAGENNDAARLTVACALALAALAAPPAAAKRAEKLRARAERALQAELARQILPDGGHISRNPALLCELLTCLIPLYEAYRHCHRAPPPLLPVAVDRMLPALRFFRHCDGSLANFNGVGPMLAQRLDIVLSGDETEAEPFSHAPHSGYQRLCGGGTVVLADTGGSPAKKLTETANAGCLSFEMSSAGQRFIVNCGTDPFGPEEFRFFGRLTAAHSTATIADTSSCRFADAENPLSLFAGPMLQTQAARLEEEDMQGFIAAHDGYKKAFNLMHERALTLSKDGAVLQGCDRFYPPAEQSGLFGLKRGFASARPVALRFHLHPDIAVSRAGAALDAETGAERDSFLLQGESEAWLFSADCPARLEDSIYFSGLSGPARTRQLVLHFAAEERDMAQWSFRRLG